MAVYTRPTAEQIAEIGNGIGLTGLVLHEVRAGTSDSNFKGVGYNRHGELETVFVRIHETPDVSRSGRPAEESAKIALYCAEVANRCRLGPDGGGIRDIYGEPVLAAVPMPYLFEPEGTPYRIMHFPNLKTGEMVAKTISVVPFIKGQEFPYKEGEPSTPEECYRAGRTLAALHVAAQGIKLDIPNPFGAAHWLDAAQVLQHGQAVRRLAKKLHRDAIDGGHLNGVDWSVTAHHTLTGLLDMAHYVASQWHSMAECLPAELGNFDFFQDNTMLTAYGILVAVDTGTVCHDVSLYDFMMGATPRVMRQAIPDAALMSPYIVGFDEVRPFTDLEIVRMPFFTLAGPLRWGLSRAQLIVDPPEHANLSPRSPKACLDQCHGWREQNWLTPDFVYQAREQAQAQDYRAAIVRERADFMQHLARF